MISIREALDTMLPAFTPLGSTSVPLSDALGRVLAQDVLCRSDLPELDNSAMDGYALRAADAKHAGTELPVYGESKAGAGIPDALPAGQAMRIFTGAPLPAGADCVVMQENTTRSTQSVLIDKPPAAGAHVRVRASDLAAGSCALPAGSVIGAGEIGLLAALSCESVSVHRKPRVAVLCTGDELRELGTPARPGTIINSNAHALAAAITLAGAEPWVLPTAADRLDAIEARIHEGLQADVLISLGGVSVGDYDFVARALEAARATLAFHNVAIKPGKPMLFGRAGNVPVVGLPGNPVSALVTFEIFVRPFLLRMAGHRAPFARSLQVELGHAYEHDLGRTELARAGLSVQGTRLIARLHARQGSGSLPSMVGCDALVILPRNVSRFEIGASVQALRLSDVPCSSVPAIDDRA